MQAAMLKSFGTPLVADDVPDPEIGTGEMIDDVIATPVLSYANEVFSGERRYPLPTPVVPGWPDPSPTGPFINLNVSLGLAAIVLTASIAAALAPDRALARPCIPGLRARERQISSYVL